MKRRIVLGGIFHETHTFVSDRTGIDGFTIRRGDELLARAGDGSTVDGFLEVAGRMGWDVVPLAEYTALPSGVIDHAVFEQFWGEIDNGLRDTLASGPVDGIWLALHGAAVTDRCEDLEGELLTRIRAVPGAEDLPVFGVFDLHATFTETMGTNANCLVAYRENPHIDARDAAVRSAELLARAFDAPALPHMRVRNIPVVWPPTGTGTGDSPMRDLEALARELEERHPAIQVVNVVAGFSFSDIRDAGVAFSVVTTGSDDEAEGALTALADLAMSSRDNGLPAEWDLDDALDEIKGLSGGPYVIVEPADNIGGGAPGDGTAVLRAFLRHGVSNAAVVIADPESVIALADLEPGACKRLHVGGKQSGLDEGPVEVDATLVSRSDGYFQLEDRNSHMVASQGTTFDMGPCAVVEVGAGVKILLTSRKTPPFDLAQLRSQGIEPEKLFVVGVKAAVAHRRAYDPIAVKSYTVTTPGPCTSDLRQLPYKRLRRPVFPLDQL